MRNTQEYGLGITGALKDVEGLVVWLISVVIAVGGTTLCLAFCSSRVWSGWPVATGNS